jgi:hypothetical protein
MRVKLCARCPYRPHDLADHYDPNADMHACAACDNQQQMRDQYELRASHRRPECATIPGDTPTTMQWNVVPFATESLV